MAIENIPDNDGVFLINEITYMSSFHTHTYTLHICTQVHVHNVCVHIHEYYHPYSKPYFRYSLYYFFVKTL